MYICVCVCVCVYCKIDRYRNNDKLTVEAHQVYSDVAGRSQGTALSARLQGFSCLLHIL